MRHNQVILTGLIEKPVEKDGATGSVSAVVCTVRAKKKSADGKDGAVFEYPTVRSSDSAICRKMSEWKPGDIVQVKGVVCTENIEKTAVCPECMSKQTVPGQSVFVVPIFAEVLKSFGECGEQAAECVREHREVSNLVTLIGMACREPYSYRYETGMIASYQVAVRRKFRVHADDTEIRTDFPWIKSFGKCAERDMLSIRKGSYLFIDGYLRNREFDRKVTCGHCGAQYLWKDSSQEVIPYSVEYLKECRNAEEVSASEKKRLLGQPDGITVTKADTDKLYVNQGTDFETNEKARMKMELDEIADIPDISWDCLFEE